MASESMALTTIGEQTQQDISLTWSQEDLQALKATVAKGCDISQFKVFVAACKRLQLDPFARQITPIVQGGGMTPQVTIDGFRLIAERTRQYGGQIGPFWCGPDGEWRDVWLTDTAPVACKVGVIRKDHAQPMWGMARTKAYAKGNLWNTMPDVMIAKVAESLALRKAFPNELSGVYTREEMQQARAEDDEANYVDTEPVRTTQTTQQESTQQQRNAQQRPAPQAPASTSGKPSPSQVNAITNLCNKLGEGLPTDLTAQNAGKYIAELQVRLRAKSQPRATVTEEPATEDNGDGPDLHELGTGYLAG